MLFRIEDEIYKMDHEIGNIETTMRTLEAEKNKIDAMTPADREQYRLDPRKFNRIRLRWIEKTYAEMGQEMLRLLP